jgi:hypothetical protein
MQKIFNAKTQRRKGAARLFWTAAGSAAPRRFWQDAFGQIEHQSHCESSVVASLLRRAKARQRDGGCQRSPKSLRLCAFALNSDLIKPAKNHERIPF